jgi:hypothetical protein
MHLRSTSSGVLDPRNCFNTQDLGMVPAGGSAGADVTVSCRWTVSESAPDTIYLEASGQFAGIFYALANSAATYERVKP